MSIAVATPNPAVAAAAPAAQGVVVSPALEQINLPKDQDSAGFNLTVTNDTPLPLTITTRTDDFTALNNTGSPQFLDNVDKKATPHGLAHWLTVSGGEFVLTPAASKSVAVSITDAASMGPGGHYGAVIFRVVPPPGGTGSNVIGANAELSSLVFLTTDNLGLQAIKLLKPMLGFASLELPGSVNLVFRNTGDVQVTPRGYVTITDTTDREIARGIINTDSGQILPETSRLYEVSLSSRGSFLWPGYYRLFVAYRYDGQATYANYEAQFWYVPGKFLVGAGAVALVVLVYLIRRLRPARFYRAKR